METSDIVTVIEPVITAFEQVGISYYIGGSAASCPVGGEAAHPVLLLLKEWGWRFE
jgi:hypothetical protein